MELEWAWKKAFLLSFVIFSNSEASNVIRVRARNYEPFVYRNSTNGQFYEGIEYHLVKTIAKKLSMNVTFQLLSTELDLLDTK